MHTDTTLMPTFAELLHKLLEERSLLLKDLAEKTGINYKTLASYTTVGDSKRRASVKNLRKIATVLEVTLASLMECKEFQED